MLLTTDALAGIAAYKRAVTVETLGARIGKVLAQYKIGKFSQWSIEPDPDRATSSGHRLVWSIDAAKVAREQRFGGSYIITSAVEPDAMNTAEVVNAYKSLTFVERAFRNPETVPTGDTPGLPLIDHADRYGRGPRAQLTQ